MELRNIGFALAHARGDSKSRNVLQHKRKRKLTFFCLDAALRVSRTSETVYLKTALHTQRRLFARIQAPCTFFFFLRNQCYIYYAVKLTPWLVLWYVVTTCD